MSRNLFFTLVGNGDLTHAWEDTWLECGYLAAHIPFRLIRAEGFNKDSMVREVVSQLHNGWPHDWLTRLPALASQPVPNLIDNKRDVVLWRLQPGHTVNFTVAAAWRTLDGHRPTLRWCKAVWFKGCIPKYSFCSWMACLRKLPTQDKIMSWKHNPPDMKCSLCEVCLDSHNHLFFECRFALKIWATVKKDAGMMQFADSWSLIIHKIDDGSCFPKRTFQKLAITATIYHVWQERNRRLFGAGKRSESQICEEIRDVVLHRLAWIHKAKRHSDRDVLVVS